MNEQLVEETQQLELALENTEESLLKEGLEGKVSVDEKHAPEDIAAAFFKLNKAKLERLIANLSAKQMRRVIMNACSYPFVDKEYLPRTQEEKQTAYTVSEMMLNKTIMTLSFEMQQAEKAMAQQETSVQNTENNVELNVTSEEKTNGTL